MPSTPPKRQTAQEKILNLLRHYGRLSVHEAQEALESSSATIRRHFAKLEEEGRILRVHGGAVLAEKKTDSEYQFQLQALSKVREKLLIGKTAASFISDHDKLFFDSGTTVLECGNALCKRLYAEELSDVTVVTNSLAYNDSLALHCPVALTGGFIRHDRMDLHGMAALQGINRYRYTKAFLGADAIGEDGTLYTTDEETAALASAAIRNSEHLFVLADSGKLCRTSFAPYGKLTAQKCTLITDQNANFSFLAKLKKSQIRIVIAGQNEASPRQ